MPRREWLLLVNVSRYVEIVETEALLIAAVWTRDWRPTRPEHRSTLPWRKVVEMS